MGRAQELYFIKSYILQTQKKVANAKHKIQRVSLLSQNTSNHWRKQTALEEVDK